MAGEDFGESSTQKSVTNTLTLDEAKDECLASGISKLEVAKLAACIDDLLN